MSVSGRKIKDNYDKKNNRNKMDRSCFGDSWNPSDDLWNLQRGDVCGFYKSNQYLYGVYWNWIIKN